ncbi:hypothetical protein H6P81_010168 [Aristolochia fimbriata]|uniref:IST1-like protein n=1 Tax=Aristolochia fimbriata TaxID=158543 RepID=A0AAV7EMZ0_ARIFI|nr:hypothetical protein H6P81_010168 [Aristolochia fimbriata]
MLDGLLGRGFSQKCKSLIAKLMNRTDILKRKKRAVIGYLKKDIADLLLNGFDINAYGRVEGLIAEVNRGCSYELMEKFCECILSQLSVMQKQRDCPEESKEAVATVMFAAARFADLPELSDLRRIFTEKYGNSLESFVNQEFVDRIALKPPSVDQKLELMQIIALEYSISWDVKRFKEKISNPSTIPGDRQTKHGSATNGKDNTAEKKQEVLTNGKEISRGPSRKDIKAEAVDSHERQSYFSHGKVDLNPGPVYTTTKEVKADRRDTHERERLSSRGRERTEPNLRAKFTSQPELNKDNRNHHPVTSDNKNVTALNACESTENVKPTFINRMPPPYVKPNGSNYRNKLEAQSTGFDDDESTSPLKQGSDKSQVRSNPVHVEREVARFPRRFVSQGNDNDIEQDNVLPEARPKPRSVRKHKKPPLAEDDIPGTRESVTEKTNGMRLERGVQATSNVRNVDEEEEMMDKLLLHYSKKSSLTSLDARKKAGLKAVLPGNDKAPYARNRGESLRPEAIRVPARVLSLPSHPATEVTRVPVRATSFEPDGCSPNGGHVHPKLPDYDELAARFLHLKEERNSSRS